MKGSDNLFPKVYLNVVTSGPTPASGNIALYAKSAGLFYKDSGGTEHAVGGGGGSAAWGAITGTLSAQTDLQAALDAKATNPMTTAGDIIFAGSLGVPQRLGAGTTGQVLTMVSGAPAWAAASGGGMTNPMTTAGDLILGGASGMPGRLGIGTAGQVLTVSGGTAAWVTPAGGAPTPLTQTTVASGSGSSMQYKSEPNLLYMANGNLLCAYRKGSLHVSNDGQIVGKISSDNGATWGSEFIIYDDPSYDARNHMLGLDASSGRIVVFFRTYDTAVNHNVDTAYVTSTDNGVTWSAKTSVASTLPASIDWAPFGRLTVSSLGWLATFYQVNKCYLLKSTDGGVTWTAQGYIYNLSQSAQFDEPNLIALDTSRLVLIVRDDESASYNLFRYYKSNDGGTTWAFSPGIQYTTSSQSLGCPCYAVRISDRKVGVVFAARTDTNAVCYSVVNLSAFAQIPYVGWDGTTSQRPARNILYYARKKWDTTVTSVTDSDFGYAFPVLIPNTEQVLIAWYDTGDGTNLNCSIFIAGAPPL